MLRRGKGEPSRQWRAGEEQQVTLVIQCEELGEILPPSTGFMRDRGSSSSHLLLSKNTKPLNSTVQQSVGSCVAGDVSQYGCAVWLFQDDYPLASLPLLGYAVSSPVEADGIQKDYVFKLQFKSHVYFFRAESKYTFER